MRFIYLPSSEHSFVRSTPSQWIIPLLSYVLLSRFQVEEGHILLHFILSFFSLIESPISLYSKKSASDELFFVINLGGVLSFSSFDSFALFVPSYVASFSILVAHICVIIHKVFLPLCHLTPGA